MYLLLLLRGGLRGDFKENMGGMHHTTRTNGLLRTIIYRLSLSQKLGIGDDGGAHLLVTIHGIFLLERGQGVELCIEGCLHL